MTGRHGSRVSFDGVLASVSALVEGSVTAPASIEWSTEPHVLCGGRRLPMEDDPQAAAETLAARGLLPSGWSEEDRVLWWCHDCRAPADFWRPCPLSCDRHPFRPRSVRSAASVAAAGIDNLVRCEELAAEGWPGHDLCVGDVDPSEWSLTHTWGPLHGSAEVPRRAFSLSDRSLPSESPIGEAWRMASERWGILMELSRCGAVGLRVYDLHAPVVAVLFGTIGRYVWPWPAG